MKYKSGILILSLLCFSIAGFSQTKDEKEERIDFNQLPEKIKSLTLPKKSKAVKYYSEVDGSKKSFEIKLKYKGKRYSIEFSEDGHLEDIEMISKFKRINNQAKTEIDSYFNTDFIKHKRIKIQKQYVYKNQSTPLQFIDSILNDVHEELCNFEIIAEVKTAAKREIREFTFDNNGKFLSFRIFNPTSYEYVLY